MKIQIIIAIAALGVIPNVGAQDDAVPPAMWKAGLRGQSQVVWDQLRKADGKVTASEVIEWMYQNHLSHHDGDSQMYTAFCLVQLADDPVVHLRKLMAEARPERRAYAVVVAGILGDTRLTEDIEGLFEDESKLGEFDGHWFWDTVGDAAKQAAKDLKNGGVADTLISEGAEIAPWIRPIKTKKDNKSERATPRKPSD